MNNSLNLTDKNFQKEVEQSTLPVLVDFWSEWCGSCKIQTPIVDALADEYKNRVKICKIEIGTNPGTAVKYKVMSIPALIFFQNGKIIESRTGLQSKAALQKILKMHALV